MATAWQQVTQVTRLFSLPDIYLRLKSVLDDPDFCLADVQDVISKDPAITMRLLRMVNSAYFGLAVEIDTVSRAINMLGTQQIHDLVLATSVSETFDEMSSDVMNMPLFWRRSVYSAVVSRLLASACHVLDSERLFVAGLLHDIGHLVMYQTLPALATQAARQAQETGEPLYLVERELMGFDHAMVGGEMMRQWGLPKSLMESTEFHLEPVKAKDCVLEASLVHIAAILATDYEADGGLEQKLSQVSDLAWETTGLTPDQCIAVHEEAKEQVMGVVNLIFSAKSAA